MDSLQLKAHLPWNRKSEFLTQILALDLAPEVAFKGPDLDDLQTDELDMLGEILAAKGLRPTVHAPFFDLNPGALDPLIRSATHQRLSQSFEAAARINAQVMVIHPGFDRWRYPNLDEVWVNNACDFFTPYLARAQAYDCRLALENIYEETPTTLVHLVDNLSSDYFGHCFDIGHWNLFAKTSMPDWLHALRDRLIHLPLHDNHGKADDHLPVGDGVIDFDLLFSSLPQSSAPTITLEAHSLSCLQRSLQQVAPYLVQQS